MTNSLVHEKTKKILIYEQANRANQTFTSLKEDLRQDINRGFAFSTLAGALMEHFLEGSAPLRLW